MPRLAGHVTVVSIRGLLEVRMSQEDMTYRVKKREEVKDFGVSCW